MEAAPRSLLEDEAAAPGPGYDRLHGAVPRPWLDWAIAAALTAIGVGMTLEPDKATVDDRRQLVIGAVTLPVIWRRRAPLRGAAALAVGTVVSGVPTFDQARCGVAIPAALLIALQRRGAAQPRRSALAGLGLVLGGMVVLLFTDPLLGTGAVFVLRCAPASGASGRLVRSRSRVAARAGRALAAARADARATAPGWRSRSTARSSRRNWTSRRGDRSARWSRSPTVGGTQGDEPARETFARIERQGRESLNAMRQMLGELRSDERDPRRSRRSPTSTRCWRARGRPASASS